jgi:hypothetical protein
MLIEVPTGPLKLSQVTELVRDEVKGATELYGPFHSAHEGYGVLLEEVDELWTEVKVRQTARDIEKMKKEAIQVAAMACRFVVDVCNEQTGRV